MPEAHMLISIKVAAKGMGLNDFVAFEEGFFAEEGIEVTFDRGPSVELSAVGKEWATLNVRKTRLSKTG